jgi:hypothetical protein
MRNARGIQKVHYESASVLCFHSTLAAGLLEGIIPA